MRRFLAAAAVAVAAVTAGCAAAPSAPPTPTTSSTTTATPTPTPTVPAAMLQFGRTHRYPDGLAVSVSRVARFKPSKELLAFYGSGAHLVAISYTVKVTNHSDVSYDTNLLDASFVLTAAGDHADALCDVAKKVTCGDARTVPPGRSFTTRYGVTIDPAQVGMADISVTPDAMHDPAVWEGPVR